MRWDTVWRTGKDIILTGTGVFLIITQVYAAQPSDVILAAGLALCIPSIYTHTVTLLGGGSSDHR